MKKKFSMPTSINSPLPTSLAGECKKATKILNSFVDPGEGLDKIIPSSILEKAQGLAIFTVLKAGFLFSGRAGSGLVVARLPDGSWSAPSAIVTGGMGAGGQIGAELTDFVLVLNTKEAVKTFSHFGNVTLGGNVSIAAGPIGRNAEASGSATLKHISAIYSYSKTRGLFAGVSLEGSVIFTRNDANEKLYGERVTAKELLNGSVAPPREADSLYRALNAKFHTLGSTGAMYQRTIQHEESKGNMYRSTSISAPGTLRIPGVRQVTGGYGAPMIAPPPAPQDQLYKQNTAPYQPQQPSSPIPTTYNTHNNYSTSTPNYTNSNTYNKPDHKQAVPPPLYEGQQLNFSRDIKKSVAAPTPPPPAPSQHSKPQRARALYAFTSEQEGDLTFQAGDIITVTEKTDSQEDWWTGRLNGQLGSFPANYVEMI
ncbi:unnamed protein product [Mucor circinelloides]|uniref:SH3 domain-containing protein n=1 Tax=Mucor circinelloides f. circinelloides (strain 1006PhL) TaxID=1220926 RepID=S2J1K3_MUCC1|nr:hypothetical protein HMPREF1544_11254 [Mucor circinelloides 1006PhL]